MNEVEVHYFQILNEVPNLRKSETKRFTIFIILRDTATDK